MADPTPGDLSARLPGYLVKALSAMEKHHARAVIEYIAALSALPAAGGVAPVLTAYRCDYCGRDYYDTANCCESRREYLAASTTPQPSAAEKCGTCGDTIKPDALTGTTCKCAAVGAQGEAASLILRLTQDADTLEADGDEHGVCQTLDDAAAFLRRLAAPAAEKGVDEHPDDLAVDRFAAAMKAKLAKKRAEGRGGWDDPAQCPVELLSNLLHEHVAKGDPVDVGNLAMMLHQRDSGVLPPQGDLQSDLDLIWHSVSDTKETNAAHARLQAALTRQPVAGESHCVACGESQCRGIVFCDPAATPTDGGEGKS